MIRAHETLLVSRAETQKPYTGKPYHRKPRARGPIDPVIRDQQRRAALETIDPSQILRLPQGDPLPESVNKPVRRSRTGIQLRETW